MDELSKKAMYKVFEAASKPLQAWLEAANAKFEFKGEDIPIGGAVATLAPIIANATITAYKEAQMKESQINHDALLHEAWGVIANAGWNVEDKTKGWQEAAIRWRDKYHIYLKQRAKALGIE